MPRTKGGVVSRRRRNRILKLAKGYFGSKHTLFKTAKEQGAYVQGTISYTISPVHTIEKYVEFAKELAAMDCDAITIKDMAGLITPQMANDLTISLKEEVGLPVNLHSHCTSGMTLMSYQAAVNAGVDMLDTAISPFSGGTAQPPTESVVAARYIAPVST